MEREDVKTKVKAAVASALKIEESEIEDDANFIFDLGADSMQSMLLIAALEEEFDIELEVEKAQEIQTVIETVEFIESYL